MPQDASLSDPQAARVAGRSQHDDAASDEEMSVSSEISAWNLAQPLMDEEYFPRIVAIFYSIFHPTQGPTVVYQVPEGSIASSSAGSATLDPGHESLTSEAVDPHLSDHGNEREMPSRPSGTRSFGTESATEPDDEENESGAAIQKESRPTAEPLFDFKILSEYIIPKAALCGRLMSCAAPATSHANHRRQSYKILSHPIILYDQTKYPRNSFLFNLAFVFDERADVRPYEPVVRKCARELSNLEQASSFLSQSQFRMYEVIEQLFEDLNSYYESFVAIPDAPHSKYVTSTAVDAMEHRQASDASSNWANLLRKQHNAVNADVRLHRAASSAVVPTQKSLRGNQDLKVASSWASRQFPQSGSIGTGASRIRPPTKRSSTDVPAGLTSSLQSSAQKPVKVNDNASMDAQDQEFSKEMYDFRPHYDRAKTSAALALSSAIANTADSFGPHEGLPTDNSSAAGSKAHDNSSRRPSVATSGARNTGGVSLRSLSNEANGSSDVTSDAEEVAGTGRRPVVASHQLSESLASGYSEAMNAVSEDDTMQDRSTDSKNVGAPASLSNVALGKREPPHGLGRTVRDAINVKLFPTHANPPVVHDWEVPVTLLDLKGRPNDNWDLTMIRILPLINGINHVKRIAQLADADLELTRQCIEHLLYYRCIIMIDTFQFTNIYTVRPSIALLAEDDVVVSECASYVTKKGYQIPSWPTLLRLYSNLRASLTISDWIDDYDVDEIGVDVRRFITFGIIKGFLRRVHRYPVLLGASGVDEMGASMREESTSRSRSRDRLATLRGVQHRERIPSVVDDNELRSRKPTDESLSLVSDPRMIATPKSTGRRRYGIQLAQGQAHHHRQTQATVVDVAHVAYDAARGFNHSDARRRDSGVQPESRTSGYYSYPEEYKSGSALPTREPLSRNISSTTIRAGASQRPLSRTIAEDASYRPSSQGVPVASAGTARTRRQQQKLSADGRGSSNLAQPQPIQIPSDLIPMLDGLHPDDAFCVRFGKSWQDILRMLVIIGQQRSLPGYGGLANNGLAGTSGFSTVRGRPSISEEPAGSFYAGLPSAEEGGIDDSAFYKLSGIWGVENGAGPNARPDVGNTPQTGVKGPQGIRKISSNIQDATQQSTRNSQGTPSATITLPKVPRYRPSGSSGSAITAQESTYSNDRQNIDADKSSARDARWDSSGFLGSAMGGSAFDDKSVNRKAPHDPAVRRAIHGNLGRVQIIVK